jgi:hypothetical protein
MRACVVKGPVTVQSCAVSFAVLATITAHVAPPSRETSIFTLPGTLDAQLMRRTTPIGHRSPPFGAMTWTVPRIVKFALLASQRTGAATVQTLMRAVVTAGPVTVHACRPSFREFAKRSVHVGVAAVALRDT